MIITNVYYKTFFVGSSPHGCHYYYSAAFRCLNCVCHRVWNEEISLNWIMHRSQRQTAPAIRISRPSRVVKSIYPRQCYFRCLLQSTILVNWRSASAFQQGVLKRETKWKKEKKNKRVCAVAQTVKSYWCEIGYIVNYWFIWFLSDHNNLHQFWSRKIKRKC